MIIECVPNISEGRDPGVIGYLEEVIHKHNNVKLLHTSVGYDANRSVFTIAGEPTAMKEAMLDFYEVALERIDMRKHEGVHPRAGAIDVCPFIPVSGISMESVIELAHDFGEAVAEKFAIPVYFYEHSSSAPYRKSLANIRQGEYEGWKNKIKLPEWAPDKGNAKFSSKSGITVIGARDYLLAYNVNVDHCTLDVVKAIARQIRERGLVIHHSGRSLSQPGLLKSVRAIGWYIDDFKRFQVSMNLTNIDVTPMHKAFEMVKKLAAYYNASVTGSELVGMMPLKSMDDAIRYYDIPKDDIQKARQLVVEKLGLNELGEINVNERIIEIKLGIQS